MPPKKPKTIQKPKNKKTAQNQTENLNPKNPTQYRDGNSLIMGQIPSLTNQMLPSSGFK